MDELIDLYSIYQRFETSQTKIQILKAIDKLAIHFKDDIDVINILNKIISIVNTMKRNQKLKLFNEHSNKILTNEASKLNTLLKLLINNEIKAYEFSAIKDGWVPPINWQVGNDELDENIQNKISISRNLYEQQITQNLVDKLKQVQLLESTFDLETFLTKLHD